MILVVDDDDAMREFSAFVIRQAGHVVRVAVDGADGLRKVTLARPDLVVLDMMMPKLDGLGFLDRLTSACQSPPPVIACSGFDCFEALAKQRGAVAFLPKPFDAAALRAAVAMSLRLPAAARVIRNCPNE